GEPEGPLSDLGSGVLMPGLVNAHCHLELSHLAGLAEETGPGFVPWGGGAGGGARGARGGAGGGGVGGAAASRAIKLLESTGTVAVGDVSNTLAHLDALDRSSLRAVVFHEVIGREHAHADEVLERATGLIARAIAPGRRARVRLAAHAPYSVSPKLLRRMADQGGPAALH